MNKNGMTDVGRTVDQKLDSLKNTMKDVVDQGTEKADAFKSRVIEAKDQALRRGNALLDRVTELIKAHPLKAVGVAFAAGYLGMRLFPALSNLMANNPTDPVVEEADRRVEQAKASLRARVAVLERRLGDVRDRIDLPEQIRRHPLPAVGIAFAFGALVGGRRRRHAAGHAASPAAPALAHKPRTLGGTALALLSALGLPLLRELAISQLKRTAAQWWSEQGGSPPEHDPVRGYPPYAEP